MTLIETTLEGEWIEMLIERFVVDTGASFSYPTLRAFVLLRDNFTCRYCGERKRHMVADHVIPLALGGEDRINNLVAACKDCNASKSDKPLAQFLTDQTGHTEK